MKHKGSENNMSKILTIALILVILVALILIFTIVLNNGQKNNGKVVKAEITKHKLITEKNTPVTNLYEIYVEGRKKPVNLSIPKHYNLDRGQIVTYKVINKKPRFIMLEENLTRED